MLKHHARLLFIVSVLLLAIVTLDFVQIGGKNTSDQNKTPRPKVNLTEKVDEIGKVLPVNSNATYYYKFYLKDQTGIALTTQSTDVASVKGATIIVSNKSSFTCGDTGTNYSFDEYDGFYKLICNEAGVMNIQISKSGYSTKNTTVTYYQGEIPTIYLSRYVAPPPPETIKTINLPSKFKEVGSETTDMTKITDTSKVDNLVLDAKIASIKYSEVVDLSAATTKDKFKELDKYVKIEKVGEVAVDSANLPVLNKKATITMKSLGYVKTPRVLVDGKEDSSVVSNIKYKDGVLNFDVTHFSTFTAAPIIGINEPANNFETNNKTVILKGTVSDPTASVSAQLNNKDLGKLKIATDGVFQKDVDLEEGLNKLVVSALGINLATASASVSGTLLKAATTNVGAYLILFLLALIAGFGLVYSGKHLLKKKQISEPKKPDQTNPPADQIPE